MPPPNHASAYHAYPSAPQSNDALRAEIDQLRGEPSALVAARAAREETLADKEKFLKLLDNLQVGGRRCHWTCTR